MSGQPTPVILDCDPGHDDAIALLLALASPELELLGVTTVAGNQTLEKTTANALRVLEFAGRGTVPVARGAARPLVREPAVAAHVHGESGLDGPDLPAAQGARSPAMPSSSSPRRSGSGRAADAGRDRAAHQRRAAARARPRRAPRTDRADGGRGGRGESHPGRRVQHLV